MEGVPGSFDVGRQALRIINHMIDACGGECGAHMCGMPLNESAISPKAVADAKRVVAVYPGLSLGARDVPISAFERWEKVFGKKIT